MGAQTNNAVVAGMRAVQSASCAELDCFVINLPYAQKRMSDFMAANGDCGLNFQRFNAVVGKSITLDQAIVLGLVKPGTTHYTPGALGAALSHRSLWRKCSESGRPIVVFEDDVVIRRDFRETFDRLLMDQLFDIVLFGYNTDSILEVQLTGDIHLGGHFSVPYPTREQLAGFSSSAPSTILLRLNHAFGSCAYAITPEGARHLLQTCFPMDGRVIELPVLRRRMKAFSLDSMANAAFRNMQAFACVPPLALPLNDPKTSTTRASSSSPRGRSERDRSPDR